MLTNFLVSFQNFVLQYFNKEGIFIFFVFVVAFFVLASIAAIWAISQGEFKNIEEAKFEMLEEAGI